MAKLNKEQQLFVELLFKDMYQRLLISAQTVFHNKCLAEELVQDTFQLACAKIGEVMSSPNPQGWMMKTLKNVIRNKKRKLAHQNMLFTPEGLSDENIPSQPGGISVELEAACTEILGETDYRLIKQVTLKESTVREAAREFGLSEDACNKRVQRGKKKLRIIFEKDSD